jgi:AraC-like DNA-binding protein
MIVIVIRSRVIRVAALRAARRIQSMAESANLADLPAFFDRVRAARCLIVHDFQPDPQESATLLRNHRSAGRGFGVLALLSPPFAPVLDRLLAVPRDLPLRGVVIFGEEPLERLTERIGAALGRGDRHALLDLLTSEWRLDPLLTEVAECELTGERPHTTVEGLLRQAGVGRKEFVRVARSRGLSPLRFLQGMRVMEAAQLLRQGCTTRRTAERLGYGSLDTLRGHFRILAGITPRASRAWTLEELAGVVGGRLGLARTA